MERTYAQFLTPENVKWFALYAFEHDLMRNVHFVGFFDELAKNVKRTNMMEKTCKTMCLKGCHDMQDDCVPEICAKCILLVPLTAMFGVQHLTMCLCFHIEPRDGCNKCLNNCDDCLTDTCKIMEIGFCCKSCIDDEVQRIQRAHEMPQTFLTAIHNTFMQKNYHEMLLNYPPYVLFCMESQLFPNKLNFAMLRGNEETREQKLIAHKTAKPINETYNENAFFWFILTPEYQTQILSHAMTYGSSCCAFCGTIDYNANRIMCDVAVENDYRMYRRVEFADSEANNALRGDSKPYQHIFDNIVFARFLKYCCLSSVDAHFLHGMFLHIIAYREFLHNFSQMKCRMMFLHEIVFGEFDANNIRDHMIGNEYLVRCINKFL